MKKRSFEGGVEVVVTTLKIEKELLRALKHLAVDKGVTVGVLLRKIAREYLEKMDAKV